MNARYFEQIQDLIAEEVGESLLLLDLQPGISEETRLNLAVDIASASAYRCAVGDAMELLRGAGAKAQADLLETQLLSRLTGGAA